MAVAPDKVIVSVTLTRSTVATIAKMAQEQRRSRSNLIDLLLAEAIKAYRVPPSRLMTGKAMA